MASTAELARVHTTLSEPAVNHLQRLVATWGLLADLCFADLLLFVPVTRSDALGDAVTGRSLAVVGQVRPLTSQTLFRADLVGSVVDAGQRPEVFRCWEHGEVVDVERAEGPGGAVVQTRCVPVRFDDATVAVLVREATPAVGRQPGELERAYVEVFDRLASMVADGLFPFSHVEGLSDEAPRVGDGLLVLDGDGRIAFASPNAVSATALGSTPTPRAPNSVRSGWTRQASRPPSPVGARSCRRWSGAPRSPWWCTACPSSPTAASPEGSCCCATSPSCGAGTACS
jgi:hypothetical protein